MCVCEQGERVFVQDPAVGGVSHHRCRYIHFPLPRELWSVLKSGGVVGGVVDPAGDHFFGVDFPPSGLRYLEAFFGVLIAIMCGMFGWMVKQRKNSCCTVVLYTLTFDLLSLPPW